VLKENQKNKIPVWLQKIQDNSSELELLISGGAIFALFQLSDLANHFIHQLQTNSHIGALNENLMFIQLFLNILIVGFVFHLILRGYWLSLVCLNYVFPNGIKWHALKRAKPFKLNTNTRNDLYNEIIRADRLCGMCMYVSVLCSVSIIGFLLATALLSGLGNLVSSQSVIRPVVDITYALFIIYYLDFFYLEF